MQEKILFRLNSPYRDEFKIRGYQFGQGEKCVAIVGAMRGDEVQQQFTCSQIVKNLMQLELENAIAPGCEILVIPSVNHFSMNINKRFWAMDNTDVNRMFPGYEKGETTQRIANALFKEVQNYQYGIQLASFYVPGEFIPHVRIMETGFQDNSIADKFGLPFVYTRIPKPFDSTILNYNWQVFGTKAFSIYAGDTEVINKESAKIAWVSVLRFLDRMNFIQYKTHDGYVAKFINDSDLTTVKSDQAGILYGIKNVWEDVKKNDLLAKILNPFTGAVLSEIKAPMSGTLFFTHQKPLIHQHSVLYKIIGY
jgi:uncharacterized protein